MNLSFLEVFHTHLPFIIILIFTLIPLLIGSFASQNSVATVNDFFIHNRTMGTTISFFTVYSTWWSSFAFLGSISYFYAVGSVYWTGIGWNVLFGLLYMLFGLKISRYGEARGYLTPIDFFQDIYGSKTLNTIITIAMIVFTIPYLQIQLYGGAIIIEIATKGMIPWQLCALMFYLIMIIYLWAGGLRAVAWTDVFYGILIFFGMIAAGLILVWQVGGVSLTFEQLIAQRPDLILLPKNSFSAGIPMWISMFFMMPLGELMSPHMWLKMYATKKTKTFYIMPLLISLATVAYVGSMLSGSAAVILKSGAVKSADAILPILLVEFAPGWLMALVMCCGVSACLSTANSEIHAVSALVTLDIYKSKIRPKSTEKHIVFVAKISIVVFSAFAYLSLILAKSPSSIVGTGFVALSGMAQIVVPVLGALLWKKSNALGAILGVLIGITFTLAFTIWKGIDFPMHPGFIALLLNATVFLLCGQFLPECKDTFHKISFYKNDDFEDFTLEK